MMSRKRNSITYLLVLIISLTSFLSILTFAQGATWSETEITSNVGSALNIDGIMEDSWTNTNINFTHFEFESSEAGSITLYVQHYGDYLYFLIIAKFLAVTEETFSIYLSDSNLTEDIFDKKQITMTNASESGNESSNALDFFKPEDSDEYSIDLEDEGFEGVARYGTNETNLDYRYYEYKIKMAPSNESASEDTEIIGYFNYVIQIGYNSSSGGEEELTDSLLVQVGPKVFAEDVRIGELDIDTKLYINVVLIIVTVIFGSFGIALISSKSKIGNLKQEEL